MLKEAQRYVSIMCAERFHNPVGVFRPSWASICRTFRWALQLDASVRRASPPRGEAHHLANWRGQGRARVGSREWRWTGVIPLRQLRTFPARRNKTHFQTVPCLLLPLFGLVFIKLLQPYRHTHSSSSTLQLFAKRPTNFPSSSKD